MKVKVKLFGTASLRFPGYKSGEAIEVEIPDCAKIRDLFANLEISIQGSIVTADGHVVEADDILADGTSVHVFSLLYGG